MIRNVVKKNVANDKRPAISYWSKDKTHCPVCGKDFMKEVMHSGSGRMIAGNLTDELHRNFEPSARYGKIIPLIYDIGACPSCNTAFFWKDFTTITDKRSLDNIYRDTKERRRAVATIFPHAELKTERTLYDGCAMYYMALLTYNKVDTNHAPTMKMAMISLRLAWLCNELNVAIPDKNFDYISQIFYRKATFLYQQVPLRETLGKETIANIANFGPDMDKNYGFDGVIYLSGLLEYKYGQREDYQARLKKLEEYKRSIARIFGLGKSSKQKPGPLLEHSRHLYETLTKELAANNVPDLDD